VLWSRLHTLVFKAMSNRRSARLNRDAGATVRQDAEPTEEHSKNALNLGSKFGLSKQRDSSSKTARKAGISEVSKKEPTSKRKRAPTPKLTPSDSESGQESEHGPQGHLDTPKPKKRFISTTLPSSTIYSSEDEIGDQGGPIATALDAKKDDEFVKSGGDFWCSQAFDYLRRFLQTQGIRVTKSKTISGLNLEYQESDCPKEVVVWEKSDDWSAKIRLYVPRHSKGKQCTIFAVKTADGDEEHEKEILQKAATSHNCLNSLTLVLHYKKDEPKPNKVTAGILSHRFTVYMIDGPEGSFIDDVIRILSTKQMDSWVVK
jgi:hypothetical protein